MAGIRDKLIHDIYERQPRNCLEDSCRGPSRPCAQIGKYLDDGFGL